MKLDKQTSGHEHIVAVDGVMLGFHAIDIEAAKRQYGLWEGVDAIIRAYTQVNPQQMAETLANNKLRRDQLASSTGSWKTKTYRGTISMPLGLTIYLEQFEPTLFKNKKTLHEFMRRYKGLRTCNIV